MNDQISAKDVVLKWQKYAIEEFGSERFLSEYRKELINLLCSWMIENKIDLEDAKFVKKDVVETLVTKDGLKGKSKYKGWKETVEKNYLSELVDMYDVVKVNTSEKFLDSKEQMAPIENPHIDKEILLNQDFAGLLKDWSERKFGTDSASYNEVRRIGGFLWMKWLDEEFYVGDKNERNEK